MQVPRVSVHMVTANSMLTLQDALGSLSRQTFEAFQLRIIDNASDDGLAEFIRTHAPAMFVVRNPHDKGVAVAHNQGVRLAMQAWRGRELSSTYILLLSTDTLLAADCLASLVERLDRDSELGAVGPIVYKLFEENSLDEALKERVESDHIESVGRLLTRGLYPVDRGRGEIDKGQYTDESFVFSPPNACILLRASALQQVKHEGEQFLDTDFRTEGVFSDLAWRLQRAGWGIAVEQSAVAHKFRGVYKPRKGKKHVQYVSLRQRDRLLYLAKHISFSQFVMRAPWLLLGESMRIARAVTADAHGLQNMRAAVRLFPRMKRKRREIKQAQRYTASVVNDYVR